MTSPAHQVRKFYKYHYRVTRIRYSCQCVAKTTLTANCDVDTDLGPEADEHCYEQHGVFYFAVDLEVIVHGE